MGPSQFDSFDSTFILGTCRLAQRPDRWAIAIRDGFIGPENRPFVMQACLDVIIKG